LPVEGSEELTGAQLRDEAIMLGLRTRQGLPLDAVPAYPAARRMVAELEAGGLVEVSGGRVRPTARGMLVADSVAAALLGRAAAPAAL
jgi:oxygen-independent coproporphyrinogen-3 oxidase